MTKRKTLFTTDATTRCNNDNTRIEMISQRRRRRRRMTLRSCCSMSLAAVVLVLLLQSVLGFTTTATTTNAISSSSTLSRLRGSSSSGTDSTISSSTISASTKGYEQQKNNNEQQAKLRRRRVQQQRQTQFFDETVKYGLPSFTMTVKVIELVAGEEDQTTTNTTTVTTDQALFSQPKAGSSVAAAELFYDRVFVPELEKVVAFHVEETMRDILIGNVSTPDGIAVPPGLSLANFEAIDWNATYMQQEPDAIQKVDGIQRSLVLVGFEDAGGLFGKTSNEMLNATDPWAEAFLFDVMKQAYGPGYSELVERFTANDILKIIEGAKITVNNPEFKPTDAPPATPPPARTPSPVAPPADDGGGGLLLLIIIIVVVVIVVLAVVAGLYWFYKRKQPKKRDWKPPPPPEESSKDEANGEGNSRRNLLLSMSSDKNKQNNSFNIHNQSFNNKSFNNKSFNNQGNSSGNNNNIKTFGESNSSGSDGHDSKNLNGSSNVNGINLDDSYNAKNNDAYNESFKEDDGDDDNDEEQQRMHEQLMEELARKLTSIPLRQPNSPSGKKKTSISSLLPPARPALKARISQRSLGRIVEEDFSLATLNSKSSGYSSMNNSGSNNESINSSNDSNNNNNNSNQEESFSLMEPGNFASIMGGVKNQRNGDKFSAGSYLSNSNSPKRSPRPSPRPCPGMTRADSARPGHLVNNLNNNRARTGSLDNMNNNNNNRQRAGSSDLRSITEASPKSKKKKKKVAAGEDNNNSGSIQSGNNSGSVESLNDSTSLQQQEQQQPANAAKRKTKKKKKPAAAISVSASSSVSSSLMSDSTSSLNDSAAASLTNVDSATDFYDAEEGDILSPKSPRPPAAVATTATNKKKKRTGGKKKKNVLHNQDSSLTGSSLNDDSVDSIYNSCSSFNSSVASEFSETGEAFEDNNNDDEQKMKKAHSDSNLHYKPSSATRGIHGSARSKSKMKPKDNIKSESALETHFEVENEDVSGEFMKTSSHSPQKAKLAALNAKLKSNIAASNNNISSTTSINILSPLALETHMEGASEDETSNSTDIDMTTASSYNTEGFPGDVGVEESRQSGPLVAMMRRSQHEEKQQQTHQHPYQNQIRGSTAPFRNSERTKTSPSTNASGSLMMEESMDMKYLFQQSSNTNSTVSDSYVNGDDSNRYESTLETNASSTMKDFTVSSTSSFMSLPPLPGSISSFNSAVAGLAAITQKLNAAHPKSMTWNVEKSFEAARANAAAAGNEGRDIWDIRDRDPQIELIDDDTSADLESLDSISIH